MSATFKWCKDKTRLATCDKQVVCVKLRGDKRWYLNGRLHRENGPAIEYASGAKWWYLNGKRHRVNGPAVECADGTKEWWLNDKEYSESDYWKEINK